MDTLAGTHPSSSPDSSAVFLVERLVYGLTAYRQAVQLYPDDHPRVQSGILQLYEELGEFMRMRKRVFVVQVREGTLYSDNEPLPEGSVAVERLAGFLRERMIQLIQLSPGVTSEEIRAFVGTLLEDPKSLSLRGRRSTKIGPNLTLYHFGLQFGEDDPVTEEEIIAGAQDAAALFGEVAVSEDGRSRWSASDWITFDRQQLDAIARAVQQEPLRSRIEEVRQRYELNREGRDFLPAFLEVLRRDARTNWQNEQSLADTIGAGLGLLEMAAQTVASAGHVPTSLVMATDAGEDPLSPHARWRLVHTFFPGKYRQRQPQEDAEHALSASSLTTPHRDREDFDWQNKAGDWNLTSLPEEEWGRCESVALGATYGQQFESARMLHECAALVEELKRLQPDESTARLRRNLLGGLLQDLPETLSREQLDQVVDQLTHLSPETRRSWQADLACELSGPDEFLETLSDGDPLRLEQLLQYPPPGLDRAIPGAGFLPEAQESLRQALRRNDAFALNLTLDAVTRASAVGAAAQWADVVRAVCRGNPALAAWIPAHIERLIGADAVEFLMAVLDDRVLNLVKDFLARAGGHRLLPLLTRFGVRHEPEARQLLHFALGLGVASVRNQAIVVIGQRRDAESTAALIDLLEAANREGVSREEVQAICDGLAGEGLGRDYLTKIVSEKKLMFLHSWKQGIRDCATTALRTRRGEVRA